MPRPAVTPKAREARTRRTVRKALARLRQHLLTDRAARLVVLVAITLAGALGFLASAGALTIGVQQMAVRYLIATLLAYITFLLLLHSWVRYRRRRLEPDLDLPDVFSSRTPSADPDSTAFAGGESGGGGGGAEWDVSVPELGTAGDSSSFSVPDSVDVDVDELWWVVVVIAVLLGGAFAVFYVLYIAPAMLAEAILDGMVVTAVYRRLRRRDVNQWSFGMLFQRTWKPAAILIASMTLAGFVAQLIVPDADSIGDIVRRFQ